MATRRRALMIGSAAATLAVMGGLGAAQAETVQFSQTFTNSTLSPDSPVFKPTLTAGTNRACLTAATVLAPTPAELGKCADTIPEPEGSGVLLLNRVAADQVGSVMASNAFAPTEGLDMSFNTYQWGSTTLRPADGIGFVLAAVDPSAPTPSAVAGPSGGSLGYSASHEFVEPKDGYANAYLGVGFDVYGNFLNPQFQGTGCSDHSWMPASGNQASNQITVRGPGNGVTGYCALESTANPALGLTQPAMSAATQSESKVPVNVSVNPTAKAFKTVEGLRVEPGEYRVSFTGIGQARQSFTGKLPSASGILPAGWLDSNGVPLRMVFGWTASTGDSNDNHAITDSRVAGLSAASKVHTTQTYAGKRIAKRNFTATTSASGAESTTNTSPKLKFCGTRGDVGGACANTVTYRTKISDGAVNGKIKLVATLPKSLKAGKVTSAAGWKCKKNSSTKITCTSKASKFKQNQKLKPVVLAVTKR